MIKTKCTNYELQRIKGFFILKKYLVFIHWYTLILGQILCFEYIRAYMVFNYVFYLFPQDAVLGVETDRGSNVKSRYLPPHLRGKPGQDGPPPENSYREPNNREKGISELRQFLFL